MKTDTDIVKWRPGDVGSYGIFTAFKQIVGMKKVTRQDNKFW